MLANWNLHCYKTTQPEAVSHGESSGPSVSNVPVNSSFIDMFKELWQVILKISDDLGIEPSRKRSVRRQQNRTNPPVTDTESYYRVAYYFAFLDHTLSHLKTRFPPELEGALLQHFYCLETYTTFRRRP